MEIEIDINSPSPVYQQLVDQVIIGVLSGTLKSGDALPAIRQLADDLRLNPNTVAKAYKQLETQRVIQTARRAGTFIRKAARENCITSIRHAAQEQLGELIEKLKERGLDNKDICSLLRSHIKQLTA
jgi:GntR family transcriptional regulator